MREDDGRVVTPVAAPVFVLDDLLANMDHATCPEKIDFGAAVGEEIG